jgi:hypothetical protein
MAFFHFGALPEHSGISLSHALIEMIEEFIFLTGMIVINPLELGLGHEPADYLGMGIWRAGIVHHFRETVTENRDLHCDFHGSPPSFLQQIWFPEHPASVVS